mmetsp:Transcript_13057/g.30918  ORF Transcript_13057/g.30918 Transcript_13057/m.30918 type:complete len:232 (+) Transcript_13057:875-1570(+)
MSMAPFLPGGVLAVSRVPRAVDSVTQPPWTRRLLMTSETLSLLLSSSTGHRTGSFSCRFSCASAFPSSGLYAVRSGGTLHSACWCSSSPLVAFKRRPFRPWNTAALPALSRLTCWRAIWLIRSSPMPSLRCGVPLWSFRRLGPRSSPLTELRLSLCYLGLVLWRYLGGLVLLPLVRHRRLMPGVRCLRLRPMPYNAYLRRPFGGTLSSASSILGHLRVCMRMGLSWSSRHR